ncbi:MAG: mechanosensitive ion channel [Lachnospiraceae bacterium]|nr:mechanosensitive ion channel [Lachnospiraceae bacterium]
MKEMIDNFLANHIQEEHLLKLTSLAWRVALAVLILILALQGVKLLKKVIRKALKKTKADEGIVGFLTSLVSVLVYIFIGFVVLQYLGVDAASIVAVLGSAGVTIGLAIQGSLSNIAGGVLILILKPFKIGDYIIEDTKMNEGTVTEIGLIYTKLLTLDSKTVVLPNGVLANSSIVNVTQTPYRLIDLKLDVAYTADYNKAKELINEVITSDESILQEKPIDIMMESWEASSIKISARFYVKNADFRVTKCRVLENIKNSFDANNIEIPFTQVVVHNSKD